MINIIDYKIRRYDTDILVTLIPKHKDIIIAPCLGDPKRKQRITDIKHNWHEKQGSKRVMATNLSFFEGPAMPLGTHYTDGGVVNNPGWPGALLQLVCHNNTLHIEKDLMASAIPTKYPGASWVVSGSYALVIDGKKNLMHKEFFPWPNERHPRTIIGDNKDYFILAIAEGRNGSAQRGITADQSANIMLELGAITALNFDGGWSTAKDVGGKVVNKSYIAGKYRPLADALLVYATKGTAYKFVGNATTSTPALPTGNDFLTYSGALKKDAKGDAVRSLQAALKTLGYYNGAIDGSFGNGTDTAVRSFQKANGLTADGSAGPSTKAKINSLLSGAPTPKPVPTPPANPTQAKKKVVWDIGHGNNTYPPSKGVPSMPEYEFNSAVVKEGIALAEHNGFEIILSQPINGRDVDINTRAKLINSSGAELLLSFHADSFHDKLVSGNQRFYWGGNTDSLRFANILEKNARQHLPTKNRPNVACKSGVTWPNFGILRLTQQKVPGVLQEHGFMTNADDLALLKSDRYRKLCGEVAVRSMCEYFGRAYKDLGDKIDNIEGEASDLIPAEVVNGKTVYTINGHKLINIEDAGTVDAVEKYRVTTAVLNLRDNKMGEIIGKLMLNDVVEVIGAHDQDKNWVIIRKEKLIGFASSTYLTKI